MNQIYYAIQNIIRGKDSTLVKVVSLSLGLFLSIVLFALVGSQFNYDSFYQEYKDIYVVETALDEGKGMKEKAGRSRAFMVSIPLLKLWWNIFQSRWKQLRPSLPSHKST